MNWVVCANVNRTWDFYHRPRAQVWGNWVKFKIRHLQNHFTRPSNESNSSELRERWMKCALRELRYCPTGYKRKMENFTMSTSTEWTRPSQSEREENRPKAQTRKNSSLLNTQQHHQQQQFHGASREREGQFQQLFFDWCVFIRNWSQWFSRDFSTNFTHATQNSLGMTHHTHGWRLNEIPHMKWFDLFAVHSLEFLDFGKGSRLEADYSWINLWKKRWNNFYSSDFRRAFIESNVEKWKMEYVQSLQESV